MNTRVFAATLVVLITICSLNLVYGIPRISQSSNSRQNDVELQDSRQRYSEAENKIKNIENKIYDLNMQIEPLQITAEKNKKEIEDITMIMDSTKKNIDQCKKELNELDLVLGQRVKGIYLSGGVEFNYLNFIFEAKSTNDLFTRVQAVSKILGKDKLAIDNIAKKKEDIDAKMNSLQERKDQIHKIDIDVQDTLSKLERKKREQEILANQAKEEKSNFDSDYLSELERDAVSAQFSVIDNSNSSLEEIQGAIDQLISIRNNQIKSSIVNEEINQKLEKAKNVVEQKNIEVRGILDSTIKSGSEKLESSVEAPAAGRVQVILNEAYKHIGKEYVWGTTGEETFDCSGYTEYVYKHALGIDISRTTYTQIGIGQEVSKDELKPGDLVFPHPGHVGIYIGNGQMIHAPQTGDVVKVGPVYNFYAARRIL